MANDQDNLEALKVFDNKLVVGSTSYESNQVIDTNQRKLIGNISLQLHVQGAGAVTVSWEQSNNYNPTTKTGDWIAPSSGSVVVSGFTETSGSNSDGKDIFNVPAFSSQYIRFKVEETGAADMTVDGWASLQ